MQTLKIDHVTMAGRQLEVLQESFARIGLPSQYGGPHSNQVTHMAALGFDDGSYIELISTLEPEKESPWWHQYIRRDGGPCAWAVQVDDIASETERIADQGVPIRGPDYHHRERPDGTLVEWDLAFLGDYEPGAKLPFLISDRTPRSVRVQPTASVYGSELVGVCWVVLAVRNLSAASELFKRVFGWSAPEIEEHPDFGAQLAAFRDQPVIMAEPMGENWLQERLEVFGESPCAYLLGSRNMDISVEERNLYSSEPWFHRQIAWFDRDDLRGTRLGVMAS